jgi:phosphoribosylanthranilate isomerase
VRPWIKICGLTSAEAVAVAVDCGVDALGFVFYAASPRNLAPAAAATLARGVPSAIARVAVTLHPTQALLDAIAAGFAPDLLQIDAADVAALQVPPGIALLPVLRSGAPAPSAMPARCLYESAASGAGLTADWDAARALARRTEIVLAGGLDPGNVAEAIRRVQPFGVDVSSGVERLPGVKDPGRIRAFVAAARAAVPA